tara:strand:- start:258 stop:824 length:567 start_codon:yes stop_codon:yes gene_type:complete
MKYEIELQRIKDYVDNCAGYDISDKRRDAEIVKFRTLYFKLAKETTHWGLKKIGSMVNRDHSTVLHAQSKLFDELMSNKHLRRLHDIYKIEVLGQQINAPYQKVEQYNILKEDYNKLISDNQSLKYLLSADDRLTNNERQYRSLTRKQKESYDERAELVLQSFKWKARNEQAEVILGSSDVSDARGIR